MTTIRIAKRERWTAVNRSAVNDPRLSFRALGVLVWLLDKPDDWRFSAESLASNEGREGRDAMRAALRELREAGYIITRRWQGERGRWGSETVLVEQPGLEETPGRTEGGFPAAGKPAAGFPADIQKTEPKTETETHMSDKSDECVQVFDRLSAEFLDFWALWPRREGKKPAMRAYRAARKIASSETIDKGVRAALAHWRANKTQKCHIPMAATWLNAERWTDELGSGRPPAPSGYEQARQVLGTARALMPAAQSLSNELRCAEWFDANYDRIVDALVSQLDKGIPAASIDLGQLLISMWPGAADR